ncbi:MAG: hypothetical protein GXP06_05970 [Alphaproteobacteria bacterium]|nr:hypothetical protein [Alphaproteobacteria bacterium]
MGKIAFLDLEASGLGSASWPIEVGWCFDDGAPETMLIRPAQEWPHEAWDDHAASLHGLAYDVLEASGLVVGEVCARLNQALEGAAVYSDAPDWDGFWLYRLFAAARARQRFSLCDFGDLLCELPPQTVAAAVAEAKISSPHRHRAREDVLHMKKIFDLATASC